MVTVLETPGLRGLELWRGVSRGGTLSQLRERRPEYFHALREFLIDLHRGEGRSSDDQETIALADAAGFARAVVCGGEASAPSLAAALEAPGLPFSIEIDPSGPFARRGALALFRSMGWRRGVALDLGQLQLKVIGENESFLLPRDTSLLPFGAAALDASLGRARLRDFLREGLTRAIETMGPPDGIALGLPVALGQDGTAQPATYPGLFWPVRELFADLADCPCVVLNDAVLAALGFPPQAGEKTLVVTLGFGVGGALWATPQ